MKTLAELTREDINELEVSDETDAYVAEAIGLTVEWLGPIPPATLPHPVVRVKPIDGLYRRPMPPNGYSGFWQPATEAADVVFPDGYTLYRNSAWTFVAMGLSRHYAYSVAPTGPLAICKAILKSAITTRDQGKDSHTPVDENRVLTNEQ